MSNFIAFSAYMNYDVVEFDLQENIILEVVFYYTIIDLQNEKSSQKRLVAQKETHNFSLAFKILKTTKVGGQRLGEAFVQKFVSHFASRQSNDVCYTAIGLATNDTTLRFNLPVSIYGTHQEAQMGRYACKVQRLEQSTLITHIENVVKTQQPIELLVPFIKPGTITIPLGVGEEQILSCTFCGFSPQNRYKPSKILGIFESVDPYIQPSLTENI